MNTQPPSIYQRVIDKTKALAFQSQFIAQNIDKRLSTHTAAMAAAPPIPAPVMVNAYIYTHTLPNWVSQTVIDNEDAA